MPTYHNISKEPNALVYYVLGQYTVKPTLSIIGFFSFIFQLMACNLEVISKQSLGKHRKEDINVSAETCKWANALLEMQGCSVNI